jgi:hypothetical protein
MGEFSDFFKLLVRALEESGIDYVIVGGIVSIHLGRPRLTQDVDVIIETKIDKVESLAECLKKRGFEVEKERFVKGITEIKAHSTIFHKNHPILHADIKGVYDELDHEVMKGRIRSRIFDIDAWVESPEDNIVAKIVYGSQQDFEDAFSVLIVQEGKLNERLMFEKAKKFNVLDKLESLIRERDRYRE